MRRKMKEKMLVWRQQIVFIGCVLKIPITPPAHPQDPPPLLPFHFSPLPLFPYLFASATITADDSITNITTIIFIISSSVSRFSSV